MDDPLGKSKSPLDNGDIVLLNTITVYTIMYLHVITKVLVF